MHFVIKQIVSQNLPYISRGGYTTPPYSRYYTYGYSYWCLFSSKSLVCIASQIISQAEEDESTTGYYIVVSL
jgi:hypothetical protein